MTTIDRFHAACDAKRAEMYGPNWQSLDWYGRPLEPKPLPFAPTAPRSYTIEIDDFESFTRGGI